MDSIQTLSILESGRRLDDTIASYKTCKSFQEKKLLKKKIHNIYTEYKNMMKMFAESISNISSEKIKLNRPDLTLPQLEQMVDLLNHNMDSVETVLKLYKNLQALQSNTPAETTFFDDEEDILFE